MSRHVSLSRAAKLVGISRGAMQKKVHNQELESFEGMVKLDDIERVFPDVQLEDNHIIEDLEKIIEGALKKARGAKLASLVAPDAQTLASRLHSINQDNAKAKNKIYAMNNLFSALQEKLTDLIDSSTQSEIFEELNNWIENSLSEIRSDDSDNAHLLTKDTILRVIAAQVHVKNTGHEYFVEGNNSILEAGLSSGFALNYGCSNGNCGKCKVKLISGDIKKIRPHDFVFSQSDKLQNYFLSCSHTAITDIVIEANEAGSEKDIPKQRISAKVNKVEKMSDDVVILNLTTPRTKRLRFLAGQNVSLSHADLPSFDIPIASCPCDDMNIQFHISHRDNSLFAQYVYEELNISDSIKIRGPKGSFILDENSNNPVLFIAFDTGFAPVKSLFEHVITLEHAEYSHLLWLHSDEEPYMHNQCRAWEDALDNFKYEHLKNDLTDKGVNTEQLEMNLEKLIKQYKDLPNKNIFICGPKNMVKKTRQILLDHNAEQDQIKTMVV